MKFELNFVDPYNWDRGQTNLGGFNVKDSFMADFHRQGFAKDFMLVGKLPLTISLSSGGEWNPTVKVDSQNFDLSKLHPFSNMLNQSLKHGRNDA